MNYILYSTKENADEIIAECVSNNTDLFINPNQFYNLEHYQNDPNRWLIDSNVRENDMDVLLMMLISNKYLKNELGKFELTINNF